MALPVERAIDLAAAEIRRLGEVCRGVDPATPVPSCPEWDIAELLRHVGMVNRWAATMVEQSSQERLKREAMESDQPDDPDALADWVAAGADFVESRFAAADPTTEMWAWGWPKNAGFWPRRMVHETGVHRADAELALGRTPAFTPEVAVDGVEELLDNLPHALYFRPSVAELKGDGEVLAFVTPEAAWTIPLHTEGFDWVGDEAPGADATLACSSATDLLLTLYGRRQPAPGEVTGDAVLVERWLTNSQL
jgi:uncharacterized protein (TIGR03083 family)